MTVEPRPTPGAASDSVPARGRPPWHRGTVKPARSDTIRAAGCRTTEVVTVFTRQDGRRGRESDTARRGL
eukprot:767410-Hanusia_phi.AAC.5